MKTFFLTVAVSLCLVPPSDAVAQTCSKQSPAHTLALLELYTSEGCNSCPPADKFISGFRSDSNAITGSSVAGLSADQVVPLSLHVDYWDYIGWKDVYARPGFTGRQRWLSELARSRTIYTPEIFAAGQELRNWSGGAAAAIKRINALPAQADIGIVLGEIANNNLPVEVNARAAQGGKLFVALYENGLSMAVKAGENRGVTLKHDFVVRELIGPIALSGDAKTGKAVLSRPVALPSGAVAKNLGVAAFVQTDKGEVLQALALPLCGS